MRKKKRRKLRKRLKRALKKRALSKSFALVVCVGKKCADRAASRAVVVEARAYAELTHPLVHVEVVGCLDICKKGPLAATYPGCELHQRVEPNAVHGLIDEIAQQRSS